MFFSKEQIEQSLKRLEELNPFFGTVFLAFKKADVPVGTTAAINFSQTMIDLLQMYYRPRSDYEGYYMPFKSSSRTNLWKRGEKQGQYDSSLQLIATTTFSDVLDHPGGKQWGWKSSYVDTLSRKHLRGDLIPTFDLAVWLYRSREWDKNVADTDVINTFFAEFLISTEERQRLFDGSLPPDNERWLQTRAVSPEELAGIIGTPPGNITEGALLKTVALSGVGPSDNIEWELASRLNLITGDNGLGKTFLLECAWWALTGTWAGYPAFPRQTATKTVPSITFQIGKESRSNKPQVMKYNRERLAWDVPAKRNILPGLSIFSQIDGSFAVWDPAKYILAGEQQSAGKNSDVVMRFSRSQVWDGIRESQGERTKVSVNGLIDDWVRWQNALDQTSFEMFSAALQTLSPAQPLFPGEALFPGPSLLPGSTNELLIPGQPTRIPNDARDIPTIKFPYGEVPVVLCSAGIQRILTLAYLLIWSWNEHVATCELMHREPQRNIVLLIDEMEAHLHPLWQRVIVPALINVLKILNSEIEVQMVIATHSPLILASVEPLFDDERDALFHFYLDDKRLVQLDEMPFVKRGPVDRWLMSDIFGLTQPRSRDAEDAIEAAKDLQLRRESSKEKVQEVSDQLIKVLAPDDEFWSRWKYFAEQRGVRFDARSTTTGA